MLRQKKLGLYWGAHGLSLVEVNKNDVSAFSVIPFDSLEKNPIVGIKSLVDDIRILDLIQTAYRACHFSTVDTCLSLPSKDIIVRWFVIPWMKPSEIHGVVSFEARKYIPFPLEELAYTYYPLVFTKDGIRQVGISFIAIRKAVLTSYLDVLRQSGLNVVYSEPACLSLVRSLVLKKHVDTKAVTAILNLDQDYAEIVITSQGAVRFIRDFKMASADDGSGEDGRKLVQAKLFNEVKMSIDFYSRQQSDADVSHVVVLLSGVSKDIVQGLHEDLGLPVRCVECATLLDKVSVSREGHIFALGAALSGGVPAVADLDLAEDHGPGAPTKEFHALVTPAKTMALVVSVGVCLVSIGVFIGSFIWSGTLLAERGQARSAAVEALGAYAEKSLDDIQSEKTSEAQKIRQFKALVFHSSSAALFVDLVRLIPDGLWFQALEFVSEQDANPAAPQGKGGQLRIDGYAYLDSPSAEFQAITRFVDLLNGDKVFSNAFSSIKSNQVRKMTLGKFQVTFFSIVCE